MSDSETTAPAFALWNVYSVGREQPAIDERAMGSLTSVLEAFSADGVVLRGLYDVSGLRAGADLMVWLHGPDPERLQSAARVLRRERAFKGLKPVWHAMGVHREAEFNRNHLPAFVRGVAPAKWLTVYPFNRSYEWYLLPEEERRGLLAEHGRAGAAYHSVLTNTVSAFALGDYEWILPLEADDPIDLVDLMRTLRATRARLHVRDETPFFTGRRIELHELYALIGA
ncbi:hydrogen peroxide-dependent heme synthase [Streptomyces fuscigenes]|uniref:hydrogen peroxide-dependent heme synthase n=1 Tax=Streptomyces fuscigenes TaxID=1528880 RepID=UPI001F3F8007|nr:hydrogen peroxide-dependent heme synthase [Streptomyces fuscigenes]MCF3961473.1 chlorite dismutase family protein [Streptomyces fuscigenes]